MTPEELAAGSKCYCFDPITAQKVIIYLLAKAAGLDSMTPAQLATAASCYCFDPITAQKVIVYLLNPVGPGGPGTFQTGDYGGAAPPWTPAAGSGIAVDTSNDRIWWYYSGAWH